MTTITGACRSRLPAVAVVVGVLWAASILILDEQPAQAVSNAGLAAVAAVAAGSCFRRARLFDGGPRRFWLLVAAGCASWSIGQVVWSWYETVLHREVPFPSLADIGYLGLPLLAGAALLSVPFGTPSAAGRTRTLIDGLLVAASLLLCSWVVVLEAIVSESEGILITVIGMAYPVGDVIVITLVAYAILSGLHSDRPLPQALPLLGVGLVAISVADTGFLVQAYSGSYASGSPIDIGWFIGFMLVALAGVQPVVAPPTALEPARRVRLSTNLLPYVAVLLALASSIVDMLRTDTTDPFAFWVRTVVLVLLVARQVLSLLENVELTRGLEQRVAVRTAELLASEQRFAALVEHSSDLITVIDGQGIIRYQSGSAERMFGIGPDQLIGRPARELMAGTSAAELLRAIEQATPTSTRVQVIRTSWRTASGLARHVEVTVTNLLATPEVGGLVLNTRDITEQIELEDQLTHQAFTDSLTSLPNRALFKDRLQHAVHRRGTATELIVYFMDLDGFKSVNDTRGHSAGDELLVRVAERLLTILRPSDTVARFGGDEFALLVDDLDPENDGTELAERLTAAFGEPFDVLGEDVHIKVSIGIARSDPDSADPEELLRNADLAMYQAKETGTGGWARYDPVLHTGLVQRVQLEADLRAALERGEFVVHYQPMISMETGRITGMEALVRWQHPERGLVRPDTFIPVAESTGLIVPIGRWVLEESCRQVVRWNATLAGRPPLRLSVNVASRQLQQSGLADDVAEVLAATGMSPLQLTLELTESVLIDNNEQTVQTLEALRAQGIKLAIDDFGTGYSSLSYLHRFPVDTLKIDRSFVERISAGGDTALVDTILQLGRSMGLETVAEGIERPQEALLLRAQGCTTGQGYHISPPVPADVFERLLRTGLVVIEDGVVVAT